MVLDDLLSNRDVDEPIRLIYKDWQLELQMWADDIFKHVVVFTAPDGTLAVELQTNANDGFNLYESGIANSGVFIVQPGGQISGKVRLHLAR